MIAVLALFVLAAAVFAGGLHIALQRYLDGQLPHVHPRTRCPGCGCKEHQ